MGTVMCAGWNFLLTVFTLFRSMLLGRYVFLHVVKSVQSVLYQVLIWDMETKEAVAKNNATDRIRCARWGAGLPKTICVLSGDGIGLLKVAVAPQRNRAAGQKKHSTASPPTEAGKFVAIARNESNGGIRSALSAGENSSTTMDPKRTPVPGTKRLLRASTTNPEDSDDSEVVSYISHSVHI
jgi:hypothetical protein